MAVSRDDLDHWFEYHPPTGDMQRIAYATVRAAAKDFAKAILEHTPPSADQTVAIRAVREAVMWANSAIANEGR